MTSLTDSSGADGKLVPVVALNGVFRSYPAKPPVKALRPVDLIVNKGDYIAIMGRSGSGKSTLLNLMGLLDTPSGGILKFEGQEVQGLNDSELTALRGMRIGFVFQSFNLITSRTVLQNVVLPMTFRGVPRSERRESAVQTLDRVGLAHKVDVLPGLLSGGERQRVAVARAIANRPSLLLCDEPTGNLDSKSASQVLDLIDGIRGAEITVVIVTHDREVASRSQRLVVVEDGVVSEGSAIATELNVS